MKKFTLSALFLAFLSITFSYSQEDLVLTSKDSIVKSSWVLGLGYNVVDDSATPFGQDILSIKDTWHMLPYPARVSIGRFFESGIGIELIATANRYKTGKKVDGNIITSPRNYYAIDGQLSYDLNKVIGETGWFDPYLHIGAGYTSIGGLERSTANAGFGFNTWFSDKWGANLNTMGKWGIEKGSTKQIQHSAGVVYRFGIKKGLSKKGLEKLALIEAAEQEKQRVADSIANVNRINEEALLAERLKQEREKARMASEEKAKLDAENARKKGIENAINELGHVYFDLNSSYLKEESKGKLEALSQILKNNPDLELKVSAHTDSRGESTYNSWLSERRVSRTVEFLTSLGITVDRLSSEAYGESMLLNDCDDHTYCPEAKHKINRRSEFLVVKY